MLLFFKTFVASAEEKNFIVALINNSPITFIDIKEKSKLIYYTKHRKNDYKNLENYYQNALEKLIAQTLLINEGVKYNNDILELSSKDALNILEAQFSNKKSLLKKFLENTQISKKILLENIQTNLISKYILRNKFKNEVKIYETEVEKQIKDIQLKQNDNQLDYEELVFYLKGNNNPDKLFNQVVFYLNKGFKFNEIIKFYQRDKNFKIFGGKSGWKNKSQMPTKLFEKLFSKKEGDIIKIKSNEKLRIVRVLAKRIKGKLSDREKLIVMIRINYSVSKLDLDEKFNKLKKIFDEDKFKSCSQLIKVLNGTGEFKSNILNARLADLNELVIREIENDMNLIKPFFLNQEALTYYICKKIKPKIKLPNYAILKENLLSKKMKILSSRFIKKLKSDSVIEIKKNFND